MASALVLAFVCSRPGMPRTICDSVPRVRRVFVGLLKPIFTFSVACMIHLPAGLRSMIITQTSNVTLSLMLNPNRVAKRKYCLTHSLFQLPPLPTGKVTDLGPNDSETATTATIGVEFSGFSSGTSKTFKICYKLLSGCKRNSGDSDACSTYSRPGTGTYTQATS